MVTFKAIDPADIDTSRSGRRGRVSYPIIKGFMELNTKVAQINDLPAGKNPQYMRSVLTMYINNHNMPIKLFSANGIMHLMRLDLHNDGTPNPDWNKGTAGLNTTEGNAGAERDVEIKPLDAAEVAARFAIEKDKTTK